MVDLGQESAFQSLLNWLDTPGQAGRNLLRGNPGAAARKAVDFLGDLVDAPLPGNWIPHISKPEDAISGSDLIGIHEPGIPKVAADILVGLATDPLSFLSFPAKGGVKLLGATVAAAGKTVDPLTLALKGGGAAVNAGAKLADRALHAGAEATTVMKSPVQDAVRRLQTTARNALGWHDLSDEKRQLLQMARAAGERHGRAGTEEAGRIMAGTTPAEQVALGDAFDGVIWKDGKPAATLPGTVPERLAALAAHDPSLRLNVLLPAAEGIQRLGKVQLKAKGVFEDGPGAGNYLQRQYHFGDRAEVGRDYSAGQSAATKERQLQAPDEVLSYLQANPTVQYERNAARRLVERAAQQGRLVERATLGRGLLGDDFTLAKDADRTSANAIIKTIGETSPDDAYRLDQVFNGMAPRNGFTSFLSSTNRLFKPAAVYGVVIPKIGSIVRNQTGMLWQAMSTPGVGIATQRHALGNFWNAVGDGWESVTKSRLTKGRLTDDFRLMDEAYAKAGGDGEKVIEFLRNQPVPRQDLIDAVEHGVMDGFVSSEKILQTARKEGWRGKFNDLWDMPGVIFQGVENRGRLSTFLDLRARHGAGKAAQLTKDAFLDYAITGGANRTLRDIVPFAQFLAKSLPQQAGLLSRLPAVGVGLAPLIGQDDHQPVYPWVAGQTHVPLGLDLKGNPQYAVGLGLPVEQLGTLPDLSGSLSDAGRSIKQKLVSSTHPLLKTAYGYVAGEDPYFETPYGSYGKVPFSSEQSATGRAYQQLASTGLIEPVHGGIHQIETATDSRRSLGVRALDLLTGTNVVSVDPDQAQAKIVSDELARHPEVRKHESYYQTGQSAAVDELMQALKASREKLKEKRNQAKVEAASVL